jgi:hypothetical protein
MNERQKNSTLPEADDLAGGPQVDEARRRWTKAGIGAGAILATLAGRPALAGVCQSPSAFASGNMSHGASAPVCSGNSPAQWAATNSWPGDFKPNDKFHAHLPAGTKVNWGNATMQQVLTTVDNTNTLPMPNPISAEFAAAALNIAAGTYPLGLTDTQLVMMWNEYANTGQYQVRAGVYWNAGQIVTYLQYMRT